METLFEQFIASLTAKKSISENTRVSYLRDLRQLFSYLKIEDARTVSEADLSSYIASLDTLGKSKATISRSIASMKAFFGYLCETGFIAQNPASTLKAPKVEKLVPTVLSDKDTMKLIAQADGEAPKSVRDRAMLELLYSTGIRVSELINIGVEDINLKNEIVRIHGAKADRDVPFGNVTKAALKKYIEKSRPSLLGEKDSPFLFVNCSGDEMSRQGFWKILKHYAKEAGIEQEITPHTLRHSFAAHLARDGRTMTDIQHMMGHSDISTTQMYSRLLNN